jgi:glycosyltransferase involved in cell wall biosynthesis
MAISVIIPTLNEELHVARAIESAIDLGPVFVVDSLSTDQTREVAEAAGATVVEHRWEGYAKQKNWALDNLPIRTEWLFFLDADEVVSSNLRSALIEATSKGVDAWYVPRRNVLLGRPLMHVWWYPDYQLRLFRRGTARYEERAVHEHMIVSGSFAYLTVPLLHENLKGMAAFLERHQRYAELEARQIVQRREERSGSISGTSIEQRWKDATAILRDPAARRRFLKQDIWHRTPFRPGIRFIWLYFVRRGFLDGRHGLAYAQLIAAYEAMIDGYLLEMDHYASASSPRLGAGGAKTSGTPADHNDAQAMLR